MGGFSLIPTAKRRNSTHTRIRILTTEHWASKATVMIAPPVVMVWRETATILTSHSLGKAHFLRQVRKNLMSLVWERWWAEKLGIFKLKVFFSILQSKIFTFEGASIGRNIGIIGCFHHLLAAELESDRPKMWCVYMLTWHILILLNAFSAFVLHVLILKTSLAKIPPVLYV